MLRVATTVPRFFCSRVIRSMSSELPPSDGGNNNKNESVFNVPENISEPTFPEYKPRTEESLEIQKARILYQSRKRGMLENDLLLSSFTHYFLADMSAEQVHMLDTIINKPSNDWDIYHWITGKTPVPAEYDNPVMDMLIEHVKNTQAENRTRMPDLKLK